MSSGPAAPPGSPRGPPVADPNAADPEIVGITADSRQVKPGYLFAALRGTQHDGRAFAAEAAAKGATAIVTDDAGTNGKPSVAHFTREIWTSLGQPAASLGTLGLVLPSGRRPGALTTPDPIALHRDLAELAAQGIEHAAIEASSHGLAQYRLDGVRGDG